jgi:hypothetical protein
VIDLAPDANERLADRLRAHGQLKRSARMRGCSQLFRASTHQKTGEIKWHTNQCKIPGCPRCERGVARRTAKRFARRVKRVQKSCGVPPSVHVKHVVLTTRTGSAAGQVLTPAQLRENLTRLFSAFGLLWSGLQPRWSTHGKGKKHDWVMKSIAFMGSKPELRSPTLTGRRLPWRWVYSRNKTVGALVSWELGGNGMLHLHCLLIGLPWLSKKPGGAGWPGLSESWKHATQQCGIYGEIVHVGDIYTKGRSGRRLRGMGHRDGAIDASLREACKYVAKPHGSSGDTEKLRELAAVASEGFPRFRLYGSLRGSPEPESAPSVYIYGPWARTQEEALEGLSATVARIEGLCVPRPPPPPDIGHPLDWGDHEWGLAG